MHDLTRLMFDDGASRKPIGTSPEFDFKFMFKGKQYGARYLDLAQFTEGDMLPKQSVGFWGPGSTGGAGLDNRGPIDGYQEPWGIHRLLSDPTFYMSKWWQSSYHPWGSFPLRMENTFLRDKLVFYTMEEIT